MQIFEWSSLSENEKGAILSRPAMNAAETIEAAVREIVETVQRDGDAALFAYTEKFDKTKLECLRIPQKAFEEASTRLSDDVKNAIHVAHQNITAFHTAQQPRPIEVETMKGVVCRLETRPIQSVGLYIPGGSAPLFSTVLMLAIPAKLAGVSRVILCTPPAVADEILFAAKVCGVDEIYSVGGAQAIAALAFGTKTIARVDKIFGPGNAYVTEAKRQVSLAKNGAAIDMPAGPSEVMVMADDTANPSFVAIDLLSQAEHGPDSQVILVTPSAALASAVADEINRLLETLPRAKIARCALLQSRLIVASDLEACIHIANRYGAEHLILQTKNAPDCVAHIKNAGSIFVGAFAPEAVGDYASGTNHVLPTYGYTKTVSSLGLADFQKRLTVQTLTREGLMALAPTVETLARAEHLEAHRLAVALRVAEIQS
ncbi:MAG: histidinol dehydrogenase [Burkholderiales bacterium]|jgi:histidinol dehydrogenase|nr:histidinol dehydrogenase [Burkholderiales bacterium]